MVVPSVSASSARNATTRLDVDVWVPRCGTGSANLNSFFRACVCEAVSMFILRCNIMSNFVCDRVAKIVVHLNYHVFRQQLLRFF